MEFDSAPVTDVHREHDYNYSSFSKTNSFENQPSKDKSQGVPSADTRVRFGHGPQTKTQSVDSFK